MSRTQYTEAERELIERALDELYDAMMDGAEPSDATIMRTTGLYCRAVSLVRDGPTGMRKVRSDFLTEKGPQPSRPRARPAGQGVLPV